MPYTDDQPGLPFSGSLPTTWQTSRVGAIHGQPKAGSQAWRIYLELRRHAQTMHELSDATGLPINLVCARVGWLRQQRLVTTDATKICPAGLPNAVWRVTATA